MAKVQVVETARLRPGRCAVSAETRGPFIDTGKSVPRYGRIYLSVAWVKTRLRDAGYLDEKTEADPEINDLQDRVSELEETEAKYNNLLDIVSEFVPTPEPEVQEVEVQVARKPTDDEIADWIRNYGADNKVVQSAKRVEKGSTEEWFSLYGDKVAVTPQEVAEEVHQEPIHPDEPMQLFSVHDQEVDLDVVLDQNVENVLTFSEDKGEGFPAALARREVFVAEREGRKPRKGVLAPLGFWNEETGEPTEINDVQQGGTEELGQRPQEENLTEFTSEEDENEDNEVPDGEETLVFGEPDSQEEE